MQDEIEAKEQLINELTRRNKYLTLLNQISWDLIRNPFLDWADSFSDLVRRAGYLADTPHAFLGLVDLDVVEEKREIEYTAGIGIFSQRTKFFEFLAQEA